MGLTFRIGLCCILGYRLWDSPSELACVVYQATGFGTHLQNWLVLYTRLQALGPTFRIGLCCILGDPPSELACVVY